MEVRGGSSRKGIEFYVVPDTGPWIPVPFASRFIMKDAWHDFVVTVENGQAWAKGARLRSMLVRYSVPGFFSSGERSEESMPISSILCGSSIRQPSSSQAAANRGRESGEDAISSVR